MKKASFTILMLLFLIVVVGCKSQKSEETFPVGVALALTGFGAFFGEVELNALELAKEEINAQGGINGKLVKLIVEDTQSDFKTTATVIKKLIEIDNVNFIIGPTFTEFGEVASPIAEENKVLLIAPSSAGETEAFKSPYFISLWPLERFEIRPIIQHIKANGKEKVAILYNQNAWSQMVNDFFVNEAVKVGIETKSFAFSPDEKDFRTALIKAKDEEFDVLYLPLLEFVRGEALKQARQIGFTQIYSTASTEDENLLSNYKTVLEGVIYPRPIEGPKQEQFTKSYKEKFGKPPTSPSAPMAYDALYLLKLAIESGAESPEEAYDFFLQLKDYEGVSNTINFNEYGMIESKDYFLKTIKDGKFVKIE